VSSNIAAIVDYSAQLAASVQGIYLPNGTTVGVRSVYGAGQGVYGDPLHPGQLIQPAPEEAIEAFMHVSDLPDAPIIAPYTQDGMVELTWLVPMRLYVPRGDLRTARQTLLPFYDAYLAAFVPDIRLGGLALIAYLASYRIESDSDWAWLAMDLHVEELVAYA
jgi:hypothetical protein